MIGDVSIMGIVNVTPDSFSDGGRYLDPQAAIAHGLRLIEEGADRLDIGGESTRPGSAPLSEDEEWARIAPVIAGLKGRGARLSVDTRHAATMQKSLDEGVDIINDISALTHDPQSMDVIARASCSVILMHMQGTPETMQAKPVYADVVGEIARYLEERVAACVAAGIDQSRIMIDPGIGFGKTLEHNLKLLNNMDKFRLLGVDVMLGASRKRFIEAICPGAGPDQRLPGSLAAVLCAYDQGIRHFRVHDVAETAQALSVRQAISHG